MTPEEYRKKHRRCGTCRYWRPPYSSNHKHSGECIAKRDYKYNNQGRFCKIYIAEEFKK